MKILRIRRGYTTNSSGGNEWVPPPDANVAPGPGQAGAAGPGASAARSHWELGLFGASPASKHVTVLATQPLPPAPAGASSTAAATPAPRSDRGASNLGLMGGLLAAVCVLFVITGLIRRALGGRDAEP